MDRYIKKKREREDGREREGGRDSTGRRYTFIMN